MRKRWLLLVLAAIFGLALLAVEEYTGELVNSGNQDGREQEPDYYGLQLQHRRYGVDGKLQQTLLSQSSRHDAAQHHTLLEQPVILTRDDQQQTWRVTAESGRINDNDHHIELATSVQIDSQPTHANQQFLTITTDRLVYSPDDTTAWSDVPVHINSNTGSTDASSMLLDLNRQRLVLHGNVSTRYAKP